MSALEKFNAVVKRLNAILGEYGEIAKARAIPGELSSNVLRYDVICRGGYERSQPAADAVMACLKEAAAAAVELGQTVRDLREEVGP